MQTIKDLIPNLTYNHKEYHDFNEIIDILKNLGFTIDLQNFCESLKLKYFSLNYKDEYYVIRIPTKYEFLKYLYDNVLNLPIKKSSEISINKKANNILNTLDQYEGCKEDIKEALLENKYIKINDIMTEEIFYITDYNYLDKYILKNQYGHIFKMRENELKFLFGVE